MTVSMTRSWPRSFVRPRNAFMTTAMTGYDRVSWARKHPSPWPVMTGCDRLWTPSFFSCPRYAVMHAVMTGHDRSRTRSRSDPFNVDHCGASAYRPNIRSPCGQNTEDITVVAFFRVVPVAAIVPVNPSGTHRHYRGTVLLCSFWLLCYSFDIFCFHHCVTFPSPISS